MGIFSGSFTAETGTITVEIDGAFTVSGSGTFRIMDIGKLEFSNEMPQKDEDNISEVATKQGGIDVTVYDTMTNGSSLYSALDELEINEQLNCKLIVNGLDTLLALDRFGFEYEEKTGFTKLKFKPRYVFPDSSTSTVTVTNVEMPIVDFYTGFATPTNIVGIDKLLNDYYDSVLMYELVDDYMGFLYGTGYTTYIKSAERSSAVPTADLILRYSTSPNFGDEDLAVPTSATGGVLANISRFAAIEGSTFGNAFGVNFYVNRLYKGSDATATFRPEINYNFVEEMEIDRKKSFIRYSKGTVLGGDYQSSTGVYASADSGTITPSLNLNLLGNQQFTFDMRYISTFSGRYRAGTGVFTDDAYTNDTTITRDAVSNGVRAYSKALGADGSRRIKFKIRNALSLKPYQAFTLSSGAPAVFRASGASSVIYRPSRLFYDFKGDYVEGEAYAIGAV